MAQRFAELIVWQVGHEIRQQVLRVTQRQPFSSDFRLRSQVENAASSICANVAEGFGRRTHGEFYQFLNYARGSIAELEDRLKDARERDYITESEWHELHVLLKRITVANARLMRSLRPT